MIQSLIYARCLLLALERYKRIISAPHREGGVNTYTSVRTTSLNMEFE